MFKLPNFNPEIKDPVCAPIVVRPFKQIGWSRGSVRGVATREMFWATGLAKTIILASAVWPNRRVSFPWQPGVAESKITYPIIETHRPFSTPQETLPDQRNMHENISYGTQTAQYLHLS